MRRSATGMDQAERSRCPVQRRAFRLRRASWPPNHDSEAGYLSVMDPGMNPIYRFNGAVSRLVLRVFFRYEAHGIENLPQGGFVLAAGHHSNFDPWPLGTA